MSTTINEYPKSSGTKEEVLAWWNEYTRNLTIDEVIERSQGYDWEPTIPDYKGYTMKIIDNTVGAEGDGEYIDYTFQIKNVSNSSDVLGYVQLRGTYNSWDASEWEDTPHVVNPVEVTEVKFK